MNSRGPSGSDKVVQGQLSNVTSKSIGSRNPQNKQTSNASTAIEKEIKSEANTIIDGRNSEKRTKNGSRWGTPADKPPSPGKTVGKSRSEYPPRPSLTQSDHPPRPQEMTQSQIYPSRPQVSRCGNPQRPVKTNAPSKTRETQHYSGRAVTSTRQVVPAGAQGPPAVTDPGIPQVQSKAPSAKPREPTANPGFKSKHTTNPPPGTQTKTQKTRTKVKRYKKYEDPNARPWKLFKWTVSSHKLKQITVILIIAGVALIVIAIVGTLGITLLL